MSRSLHAPGCRQVARHVLGGALLVALILQTGCAVVMAANQPAKKNLKRLDPGTPRGLVLAEFGQPSATETRDGKRTDIFVFTQGYDKLNKGTRVVGHAVADFFTLGLWEIAGTPGEMAFDGDKMVYQVVYDANDNVISALLLERKLMAGDEVKSRAQP